MSARQTILIINPFYQGENTMVDYEITVVSAPDREEVKLLGLPMNRVSL